MLLPKRVEKHKTKKLTKEKTIEEWVKLLPTKAHYILDNKNAIVLKKNEDRSEHEEHYIMSHLRLIGKSLKEMNSWYLKGYYFGYIETISVIEEYKLFKVQNGWGSFNALYDYENAKFVVPKNTWGLLDFGHKNINLKDYNGILASFSISSTYESDDIISYVNPVTHEKLNAQFSISDGDYYAILNLDGTIRGNKLFKGKSFSKIEEIINLNEYESLEEFKKLRKKWCNEMKQKNKNAYQEMIKKRNDGSISPYLDSEVMRILKMKH